MIEHGVIIAHVIEQRRLPVSRDRGRRAGAERHDPASRLQPRRVSRHRIRLRADRPAARARAPPLKTGAGQAANLDGGPRVIDRDDTYDDHPHPGRRLAAAAHRSRRHRVPEAEGRERRTQAAASRVRSARLPRRGRPRRPAARAPDRWPVGQVAARRGDRADVRGRLLPRALGAGQRSSVPGRRTARRACAAGDADGRRGPAVRRRRPGLRRSVDAAFRPRGSPDAGDGRPVRPGAPHRCSPAADRRRGSGATRPTRPSPTSAVEATPTLAIEGRTDRLVWTVDLAGDRTCFAVDQRRGRRARAHGARAPRPLRARRRRDIRPPLQPPRRGSMVLERDHDDVAASTSTPPRSTRPSRTSRRPSSTRCSGSARGAAGSGTRSGDGLRPRSSPATVSDQRSYFTKSARSDHREGLQRAADLLLGADAEDARGRMGPRAQRLRALSGRRGARRQRRDRRQRRRRDGGRLELGRQRQRHARLLPLERRRAAGSPGTPASAATVPAVFLFNSDRQQLQPAVLRAGALELLLDRRPRGRPLHQLAVRGLERARPAPSWASSLNEGPLDGAGGAAGQAALRSRTRDTTSRST